MGNEALLLRAAIYCRKSSEEGLEQEFNSLQAQREACEAFVTSQRQEGWRVVPARYDDGGYSGGNMERPALQQLLHDVKDGKVNVIVVYKVDRLTRSLADFAKIIEALDAHQVSFVSVTQQFNTTSSMGRLTLNVLLSFAQFEREVTGERIRDKIAASKKKGMWMGGFVPLGYDVCERKLIPNVEESALVQEIFSLYLDLGCVSKLKQELDRTGRRSKVWRSRAGTRRGDAQFSRGALYDLLQNRLYVGEIRHGKRWYPGLHEAIVPGELWERVQARLAANREVRSIRIREHSSSLLTGLIEDGQGNRFTPSFTVKNRRRYRYYVSREAIDHTGRKRQEPKRWPAKELEDVVLGRVHSFLLSPNELFDAYGDEDPNELTADWITAARDLADRWPRCSPAEIQELVNSCIAKILVEQGVVEIWLNQTALSRSLMPSAPGNSDALRSQTESAVLRLRVEAKLQRRGGELCLLLPTPGDQEKVRSCPNPSLIKAVVRAYRWSELLLKADAGNYASLAAEHGVGDRYFARVLQFAFLAPDIVESILEGTQPPSLTFAKMAQDIPLSWVEQRKRFGFPAFSGD